MKYSQDSEVYKVAEIGGERPFQRITIQQSDQMHILFQRISNLLQAIA
jgi:hypothetical protein